MTEQNIFDLTNLSDLPEKIQQQVTPKPKRERVKRERATRKLWIADLLALAGRPLSAAEILVARVRTAGKGTAATVYSAAQNAVKTGRIAKSGPPRARRYELVVVEQNGQDGA